MTLETGFWSWLSGSRRELGAALHIERIENMLGAGTPDVEGFLSLPKTPRLEAFVGQFWLELKSHERPAKPSTPIRFPLAKRDAQIEFMRKRWELGGNAFWLLQVGSGHERQLYLARGDLGAQLKAGMTESDLLVHVAAYGFIGRKATPGEVIKQVVTCRKNSFRIGL